MIEYLSSVSYFEYFKNKNNKEHFANGIMKSGQIIRDYYLSVLHTVGNFSLPNKSFHISTSLEFDVEKEFSGKDNKGFVLFYMHRKKDELYLSHEREKLLEQYNLPLVHEQSIYPDQFEIPIRAGIYPQDIAFIYGC